MNPQDSSHHETSFQQEEGVQQQVELSSSSVDKGDAICGDGEEKAVLQENTVPSEEGLTHESSEHCEDPTDEEEESIFSDPPEGLLKVKW